MEKQFSDPLLPVNASPAAMHRRQMRMQVWLPLGLGILFVLVFAVWAIIGTVQGSDQVNRWGNLAAVWVILPVLLFGLILLALVGAGVFGLYKLLQKMPGWMTRLQILFLRIERGVRAGSDKAVQPIVKVNTFNARVRAFWRRYFG